MLARLVRTQLALPFAILFAALTARGQCITQFTPGDGAPGASGPVNASVLWDADGVGPAGPLLVIGGSFTVAGDALALNVASFDPATGQWAAFGTGIDGEVVALAVDAVGTLLAAANAGTTTAGHRVLAWNGTSWVQRGPAFDQVLRCLLALPNGDLLVGGEFASVGAIAASRLARWSGASWSAFGLGTDGPVRAIIAMPNGDVVVGGTFGTIDGVSANCVARWDGATWSPLGTGIPVIGIDGPYAFAVMPNGDLVAAGFFPGAGGIYVGNIARWNGLAWSAFGSGLNTDLQFTGSAKSVLVLANGDLVVGGIFSMAGGVSARGIARWNGTSWSAIGPGFQQFGTFSPARVSALAQLPNGDLVAGGRLQSAGGTIGENLSRWDGIAWRSLARGFNGAVLAIAEGAAGDVVAGGSFTVAGGVAANRVARWTGSAWGPLGSGTNGTVNAVAVLSNGDVIVGGNFTTAGGLTANRVARWNGSAWSAMGSGMNSGVASLEVLPNGDLIAGGAFSTADGLPAAHLARWTGSGWVSFAGGVAPGSVTAMHVRTDGTLFVGGSFSAAGGVPVTNMAAWNGTSWTAMGSAPPNPYAITTALGGSILACHSSSISRWTAGGWSPLGLSATSNVFGIAGLPDGDLIAVGAFDLIGPPFLFTLGVARWTSTGWTAVDGGLGEGLGRVVRMLTNGDIAIGGEFQRAGGEQSPWFARITTTCPAGVTPLGPGCASSGGSNLLQVTQRAWIGGPLRVRSTGVPAIAFVVAVTGFSTTSLPLAAVLPAGPGCDLFVTPDLLDIVLAVGGAAQVELLIPDSPSLVGAAFHHQHVPLEFDLGGALVAATATNAVTLTIGAL
ncbi:MAG TPA: hypothetical protein VFD82_13115 [Planctomycetota bacterium]|nr:hypothetical protein [Planctomycetota bacterium]